VHVLSVIDGCMPADMATGHAEQIEEERRLLYVAVTRARRHLNLVAPHRFHVTQQSRHGDRHLYAVPSRFLTPEVMAGLEPAGDPVVPPSGLGLGLPPGSADVAARLRGRWS
jgi:DNA helicase II / ATP-dependent DNA helicase PcrA